MDAASHAARFARARLTRRAAIGMIGGAAAATTASGLLATVGRGTAGAAEEVVLAGVYPSTGAYASFGRDTERGIKLALSERGDKVLGGPIRFVSRDTQTNPGVGAQVVAELADHDGARFFVGVASSAVALAIEPVAAQKKSIFFTSVGADEVTGKDCNAYTFRWSVPTYGAVRSTMLPLLQREPNIKTLYTITPSYVFGDSLLRNVKEVAQERNLQLLGNDYHPLGAVEYANYITKAVAAKPDLLILLNFGGDAVKALKTAASFGVTRSTKILYVWSGGLPDYEAIGPDALAGVYVGCQYWHEASPTSLRVSAAYQKLFGEPIGYPAASSYIEAKLILDGIARAKSSDATTVAKTLAGMKYVGPTGPEEIRAFDHQVIKPYYLLRGKAKSAMKNQWDYVETLTSTSYPVPQSRSDCKMSAT